MNAKFKVGNNSDPAIKWVSVDSEAGRILALTLGTLEKYPQVSASARSIHFQDHSVFSGMRVR